MEKKNLNEDLERFNNLIGYNPSEGNVVVEAKTRRTYLSEEEPEAEEAPAEEEVKKHQLKKHQLKKHQWKMNLGPQMNLQQLMN
jgi:hypothetical protein